MAQISTAVDRDSYSKLNEDLKDMVEKSRDEVHMSYLEGNTGPFDGKEFNRRASANWSLWKLCTFP